MAQIHFVLGWDIRTGTFSIILPLKKFMSLCCSIFISSRATVYQDTRCFAHIWSRWCWPAWSRNKRIGTKPSSTCAKCG